MGAVIPRDPKAKNTDSEADILDRAGNAVLGLINTAARTAEADLQAAREVADKLADQLRAAQNQINELEANVRYYQDRTGRAEKWLHQISLGIERRFLGADDSDGARRMAERLQNQDKTEAMPRPGRRERTTPSFLGRLAKR
jgi:chromosome segregation ATPase